MLIQILFATFDTAWKTYEKTMNEALYWSSQLVITGLVGYESNDDDCSKNGGIAYKDQVEDKFYPVQYRKGLGYDDLINLTSNGNPLKAFNAGVIICLKREKLDKAYHFLSEIVTYTATSKETRDCPAKVGYEVQTLTFGSSLVYHCGNFRHFEKEDKFKKYFLIKEAITQIQAISNNCPDSYLSTDNSPVPYTCLCKKSNYDFGNLNVKSSIFELSSSSVYICSTNHYNKDSDK